MINPNFAVIDDDKNEISRIIYILRDVSDKYEINFEVFSPQSDDELKIILGLLEMNKFSGLIIDQQLGDHSYISLLGIEVAQRMRKLNSEIPIFILTKYVGDLSLLESGFSIDDAIDKSQIIEYPEAFLGRLLRSVGRYASAREAIIIERDELIKKSYERELSIEEAQRLIEMKIQINPTGLISGAIEDTENPIFKRFSSKLDETLNLLKKWEKDDE